MTADRALLFLYAETPVHAGADTGLGALDLPIQREVTTGLPIIKGESLKGALREHLRPVLDDVVWRKIFGAPLPKSGIAGGSLAPGELRVHEAQLVAFPVPTLDGFAWVTSPLVRARLHRRARLAKITSLPGDDSPAAVPDSDAEDAEPDDDTRCLMTDTRLGGRKAPRPKQVVLGSYSFTAEGNQGLRDWVATVSRAGLPGRPEHRHFARLLERELHQVSDVAMKAITLECTVVSPRVQLGAEDKVTGEPTKTVKHGPFYSEYLPGETLLAALLESASAGHLDLLREHLSDQVIQLGGDETIGKGLVWCRIPQPSDFPALPATVGANGAAR